MRRRRNLKRTLTQLLALAMIAPLLIAAASTVGKRVSLFNGKNLDGWTVLKCEAKVDGGDILIQSGNGLLQSKKKYADFVMEWDWKMLAADKWDSGIYFRYTEVPKKKAWPARYQCNLRKGQEGNIAELKGATSTGLIKPGEWNTFKLTVKGSQCDLQINGKQAWKAEGLEGPRSGYVALQAEVPNGGQHRFRNIYITELETEKAKEYRARPGRRRPPASV
jgi:hypothetical protein